MRNISAGSIHQEMRLFKNILKESYELVPIVWPETHTGFDKLNKLDTSFLGTQDYMGIAYFWNYEYRHSLRDAGSKKRKQVHDAFMKAKLPLDGASDAHEKIVMQFAR